MVEDCWVRVESAKSHGWRSIEDVGTAEDGISGGEVSLEVSVVGGNFSAAG